MSNSIKPGDVVTLNSGGQKMTVEVVDADGVFCVWFDGSSKKTGLFDPVTLKRVPTIAELGEKLA